MHCAHQHLDVTDSTNARARELAAELRECRRDTLITASYQTAGRGQRGNHWESDPGANALFSLLFFPHDEIKAVNQFALSKAIAIAIAEVLAEGYVDTSRHAVKIKWPNDIYVDDRKIAGILIENSLSGSVIGHSIIGVGINVNQREFHSDAPNPVSLYRLDPEGGDRDVAELIDRVVDRFYRLIDFANDTSLESPVGHVRFFDLLWRGDGRLYPFVDDSGKRFNARIHAIDSLGNLTLLTEDNDYRMFRFKEVAFILPSV